MQLLAPLTVSLAILLPAVAGAGPLPVVQRDGRAHVTAAALEREAGIVLKRLPARGGYVACGLDRCAPLQSVVTDAGVVLAPVDALSEALQLSAHFDDQRRHVSFTSASRTPADVAGLARVGAILPNLRLTQLDGTPVSLDDFRGRRVLINSWASW
jgi:hypothetical protein